MWKFSEYRAIERPDIRGCVRHGYVKVDGMVKQLADTSSSSELVSNLRH